MVLRSIHSSRDHMTLQQLIKELDTDRDGKISRNELREALRSRGGWFNTVRAGHALRQADKDNNGFVDDTEVENLIAFAQKNLGIKITAC